MRLVCAVALYLCWAPPVHGRDTASPFPYFLAAGGTSCSAACSQNGLDCDLEAVKAVAKSVPICKEIIEGLGKQPQEGGEYPDDNSGCVYHPGQTGWYQVFKKGTEPTCEEVNPDTSRRRICACKTPVRVPSADLGGTKDGNVAVAILQVSSDTPRSQRLEETHKAMESVSPHADIALVPESWLSDSSELSAYADLAISFQTYLGISYRDGPNTTFVLLDHVGHHALHYTKPTGTADAPTCGSDFNITTVHLVKSGARIIVGAMLGTDHLFMEPTRVLMILGAQLILHPTKGAITDGDRRHLFWNQRLNGLDIVSATYSEDGGSIGLPWSQDSENLCYWSSAQGSSPSSFQKLDPCLILPKGQMTVVYNTSIPRSAHGDQLWSASESSRRPFVYQPLCYDQEASRVGAHAAHLQSATLKSASQPFKVRVAMLQLAAAFSPSDPLAASAKKATEAIKLAKQRGADIALLPEQWSVGYMANFRADHYFDRDSAAFAYGSYNTWATPVDGSYIQQFQDLAQELGIAIALPFVESVRTEGGAPVPARNSVAVIDRFGRIVYIFSKVHLAWYGQGYGDCESLNSAGYGFYSGNLDIEGKGNVTVSSFICFDREHPESGRSCQKAGAELVLAPTACGVDWASIDLVSVHASSNAMAIAITNYATARNHTPYPQQRGKAGTYYCGGLDCNGQSIAMDHLGNIVTLAPGDPMQPNTHPGEEGIYMADFDIAALRQYRQTAKAKALMSPGLHPELCRLPIESRFVACRTCNDHRLWV